MAVSENDVRHVAALARLGVPDERLPALARELSAILGHMEALGRVKTIDHDPVHGVGSGGMPLRADGGEPYALARPREDFAPSTRDGFFLVPRLATHADAGAAEESWARPRRRGSARRRWPARCAPAARRRSTRCAPPARGARSSTSVRRG
ncbi:Asp-tRNA(Asn)/Glu-tRNA(Gln) amidotransferase subunit GatC [Roseisolibacter sp. H3M3-2]|uniref:Asp-tRNA(Asn)/Glu-tRNA(Gln) amidotransferase subunit GatC n=1 Tax=Roseisolibacter sp. H3M3-2 TaxID=3031323 RepID=UPI0023DA7150|nr:Asp-tRNA(Asn)/Glu-tRNA(Gln) amidotransferase subunit GatC [Roseisolibacter sp. H3M3-2]MDF1502519.1 aspartyl/glutamyl-tRNA amidotransferase subunit C [Roseisolibacter sp. H3M3-2]